MNRPTVIAVDFDGTLCAFAFPGIGEPNMRIINALKLMRRAGSVLILWTCRETENLQEAIDWCKLHGLEFDKVNTDADGIPWEPGRKVVADIYIDDRSMTPDHFCEFYEDAVRSNVIVIPKVDFPD